jgi:HK97 family phage major capsid protein
MSIELLEDSPIAEQLVETVLLRAAAVEIDRVMLAAVGNQVAPSDEPKGLINWPIGHVDAVVPPVGFAPELAAMAQVLAANDTPTAMIGNTAGMIERAGLTDTTGQPLRMPEPLASLPKFWTPVMPANTSVVGNFQWLAWGLRTGLTLEATRVGGDGTFAKVQYLIRLYWRGDTLVLRPSSFSKVAPVTP